MAAYYNEIDKGAAAWLRELIARELIAEGDVDERNIRDVLPSELRGYTQCHFFAGIGGWSRTLRLAGWPDDKPVWTGSCPCQPFSAAGKHGGVADDRHLWPEFFRLIGQCRPAMVFGEQVASAAGLGWRDLVQADLEGADYAAGAADLCAAGLGAPHIRQRLYWVAYAGEQLGDETRSRAAGRRVEPADGGGAGGLADADHPERGRDGARGNDGVGREAGRIESADAARPDRGAGGLEHTAGDGRLARRAAPERGSAPGGRGPDGLGSGAVPGAPDLFWRAADWLPCRDGRWRPVEPGTQPLADGVPGRVGRLRGYGNAVVPQVAAAFIEAAKGWPGLDG